MKQVFLIIFIAALSAATVHAQKKTFVRDYTYQASEADSKLTSRANATTQMRNILLREVGEFLHTEQTLTTDSHTQEYSEKVEAITAGIVEMKTLDEQWDGAIYYIKAEMTVDLKEVERRIAEVLNDKQKTKELEESRKRTLATETEVERLKKELEESKSEQQRLALQTKYRQQMSVLSAEEYFIRANIALNHGWNEQAIEQYNQAYDHLPENEETYLLMGNAYSKVRDEGLEKAAECYENYLRTSPGDAEVCILLGDVYQQMYNSNRYGHSRYNTLYKNYYERAERFYRDVIMDNPDDLKKIETYKKLYAIASRLGKGAEAEKYKEKINEIKQKQDEINRKKTTFNISGQVKDKKGEPLPNVWVWELGNRSNETRTDVHGNYSLMVQQDGGFLFFYEAGFSNELIRFSGNADTVINATLEKERTTDSGVFLSYIYDNSPHKSASPMHGISLFNFGNAYSRWGWYASLRANGAFFQSNPEPSSIPGFAFNAGAILKLFRPVSLYFGPGVGNYAYNALSIDNAGSSTNEKKREWYFNPELGIALNFRYVTLFGGIKYPLPANDAYEKFIWSAGAGINFGEIISVDWESVPGGAFLSYIYDSGPLKSAGPMHGVSLLNFMNEDIRWGWYASFRANAAFFRSNPEPPSIPGFAFNAGAILKLFWPVSLYFGPGVGNYTYNALTIDAAGSLTSEKKREYYFNPELGIALNFHYISLFGGVKYPLPADDAYEKFLWSAGAGFLIDTEDRYNDYDNVGRMLVSYMPDIPVSTTAKNPPGFLGLTLGGFADVDTERGSLGGYFSFRGNALIFGGGGGEDSDLAHISGTCGLIGSPMLYPLFFSVGLGGYWEWSKQTRTTAYLMPEIGVHILCYNGLLLSMGRSFPGFKNDKAIYTAGIGILFGVE